MTNTEKRLEFEEEVAKELGYVSALFMSQECKGTEIVMPTEELKEVADRIRLYAFFSIQQAVEEERERVRKEIEFVKTNIAWQRTQGIDADSGDDARQIGWDGACDLILSSLKDTKSSEKTEETNNK